MRKFAPTTLGWALLWALWVWVSRHNHPSLAIDAAATAVMLAGSVILFYVYRTLAKSSRSAFSAAMLLWLVSVPVSLVAVLAIKAIYDVWVGPNPLRFGFLTNWLLDWAFIAINFALASAAAWLVRLTTRSR